MRLPFSFHYRRPCFYGDKNSAYSKLNRCFCSPVMPMNPTRQKNSPVTRPASFSFPTFLQVKKLFTAASPLFKVLTLASFYLLYGCNSNERVDNSGALSSEIKSMKIKRVTDAELTSALHSTGQKIAAAATKSLEKDPAPEKGCGSPDSLRAIGQLKLRTGAEIGLVLARDTSDSRLFPKETDLLKAYAYQARLGAGLEDNLQKINDTLSIYYAPVDPGSVLFKKCGEAAGSPFVLWRIVLNRKKVIQSLDK